MPKRKISNPQFESNLARNKYSNELKISRFIGISLSGGKNEKTCITFLDYYPEHGKVFLKEIYDRIPSEDFVSQDANLLRILNEKDKSVKLVAIDAPLYLPNCLVKKCSGIEDCKSKTTQWHWLQYKKLKKKKKKVKLFTPYTERCVERYINYELEEFYEMPECLGSNKAPLTARSVFLREKINKNLIEVFPKVCVHRFGEKMNMSKKQIKQYKHSIHGLDCRKTFLSELMSEDFLFVYDQDFNKLVENPHAFESMICALTAVLKFNNQTEKPPKDFPLQEGWVEFPKKDFKLKNK